MRSIGWLSVNPGISFLPLRISFISFGPFANGLTAAPWGVIFGMAVESFPRVSESCRACKDSPGSEGSLALSSSGMDGARPGWGPRVAAWVTRAGMGLDVGTDRGRAPFGDRGDTCPVAARVVGCPSAHGSVSPPASQDSPYVLLVRALRTGSLDPPCRASHILEASAMPMTLTESLPPLSLGCACCGGGCTTPGFRNPPASTFPGIFGGIREAAAPSWG